jgi:hypothetical protein
MRYCLLVGSWSQRAISVVDLFCLSHISQQSNFSNIINDGDVKIVARCYLLISSRKQLTGRISYVHDRPINTAAII